MQDPELTSSPVHANGSLGRSISHASSGTASDASTTDQASSGFSVSHFMGAVANLCSATLGAGILALPFAMYEAGLIFGLFLLLASAWATAASIDLIVQACDFYHLGTYESVVEKALGVKWRQTVEISILIFCGGTAVAYVIAVGDIMERVEDLGNETHRRLAMSFVWLLAMLPLSCLRRMQSLQCASSVGIMSIGTLLVAATVHLFLPPGDDDSTSGTGSSNYLGMQDLELFLWPNHGCLSILRACPIFFFAYSCQVNVAQIYDELPGQAADNSSEQRTIETIISTRGKRMSQVTWVAIALCTLLYGSISLVTLLDFGDGVLPNVLSCYRLVGKESALLHLAFLAMALAVIMAFPLNVFPARLSIIQMWEAASSKRAAQRTQVGTEAGEDAQEPLLAKSKADAATLTISGYGSEEEGSPSNEDMLRPVAPTPSGIETGDEPEFHVRQHQVVTLLVAGSALGLALIVPNISVVFGLLGGTTSSLLGFVVPGLLGLAMDDGCSPKATSWILVVAGTIIGVVTTGVTLYSTV